MRVVVNASPLIFLSKLNKLSLLHELFEEVFTSEEALNEVLEGLEYGYQDALLVKKKVEEKEIKIIRVNKRLSLESLGCGEKSILEAALEHKINTVILDDMVAIKIARYFKLNIIRTPFVLLRALKKKKIKKEDFKESFDNLIKYDYRISPILYKEIIDLAEKSQ